MKQEKVTHVCLSAMVKVQRYKQLYMMLFDCQWANLLNYPVPKENVKCLLRGDCNMSYD